MIVHLITAVAVAAQVQVSGQSGRDSLDRRTVGIQIRVGGPAVRDSFRRAPVTAEHRRTAFRTAAAGELLLAARAARMRQDSALRSYDAKVFQRISVGMSLRATGRERLIMRDEGVARVQWDRTAGAVLDLTGKRMTVPMDDDPEQLPGDLRNSSSLPIPYYPGRETLWVGGSMAQMEVDEGSFVHPLAEGSEAYYTYAIGDSVIFTLPDERRITLRELRIEARAPRWNLMVGSFWFDIATAQLVRAIYRPAVELDVWQVASESSDDPEDRPPAIVRGLVTPFRASMQIFSVEFALFETRFWLPVKQIAEGKAQMSLLHVPLTFEERYDYATVNGRVDVAGPMSRVATPPPPLRIEGRRELRDSLIAAGVERRRADSIVNARVRVALDSVRGTPIFRRSVDSLVATGMTVPAAQAAIRARNRARADSVRRVECPTPDATTARRFRRGDGTLDVLLRVPCDSTVLLKSPDLPPSAYETGESVFSKREMETITKVLDFGLQAAWGPRKPTVDWGLGETRYNRVEGFSTGLAMRQELGNGYTWTLRARGSQGDRQLGGELGIARGNTRTTLGLNAYRRLTSASDWGTPLTFSASLPGLLYARDEGFYYRAWGAELVRTTEWHGRLESRLFAEDQSNAPVTTRFSLFRGSHDERFIGNVHALDARFAGGSLRWSDGWGLNPRGWRAFADLRLEGARELGGGETSYGRGALDLTVSRGFFGYASLGVTLAAGSSVGDVPPQREWILGSVQTVRGQTAGVAAGNAFWFARTELARDKQFLFRPTLFTDWGWAGARENFGERIRPLTGVGVGVSMFDGMMRFDVARGLYPRERWRVDFSLESRF